MRRYLVFSIFGIGLLMSTFSTYAASVALPVIIAEMNVTLILAGWILTAYSLSYTIVMPLSGKICEAFGKKKTLIGCFLLFTVGSLACALAPNIYFLIGARVLQAIGGGGFMPCATAITFDEFRESRQKYIGLLSTMVPVGIIIGPNLGGWIAEAFGWRYIFWFNVPLGILMMIICQFLVRPDARNPEKQTIDFIGGGLLFVCLFALIFGLTELGGNKTGTSWVVTAVLLLVGFGMIMPFLYWEKRTKQPIVDFQLLRRKPFLAANIYNLFYGVCALGVRSLVPLYAVTAYKMTILQSGILLTPWSVGMIISSTITSFLLARWGYRWPIIIGSLLLAAGLIVLALQPQGLDIGGFHLGATPLLLIVMGVCGLAHGIITPSSNNACIELMPDKVSTITGLRGMFRNLGSAIGVAVTTIILHSVTNVQIAFNVALMGSAVLMLMAMPAVFAMPASADASPAREEKGV
jgi:EmrB/QacA subfamily drug resistance transporter